MGGGDALRSDLGLTGGGPAGSVGNLIQRHNHAADLLRIEMIFYTASFIVLVSLVRHRDGARTRVGWLDSLIGWHCDCFAASRWPGS